MKFTLVALSSLLALVAAQDSSSTTNDAPATTQSLTPAQSCLLQCDPSDRCCRAECIGVPCPSDEQANDTNSCVANCDQGSGSEADAQAYAECQARCITTTFFPGTATTAPSSSSTDSSATSTGDSSNDSNDDSNDDSDDDSNSNDSGSSSGSETPNSTGSGDDPSETNGAVKLGASAAGLAGFLVAAWAL